MNQSITKVREYWLFTFDEQEQPTPKLCLTLCLGNNSNNVSTIDDLNPPNM